MTTSLDSSALVAPLSNQVTEYVPSIPAMIEESTDHSEAVFRRVSLSRFQDFIIRLTENGSRVYSSHEASNNVKARNWIADQLVEVSNGRIEVEILGNYRSVLGKLPGYLPVDCPAFVIGGHFDSVATSPGANDDATGIATTLELARVLSLYEWPVDIYFGAWNAEEIGLLGSQEVARILRERDVKIMLYYNIDMLLVPDPTVPQDQKILMAYQPGNYSHGMFWGDLARSMSLSYGYNMITPIAQTDLPGGGSSDHASFISEGYRSVFITESGFAFDTTYHSPDDVWNNPLFNYTVAIEAVRAIGSSIAFVLAREFESPTVIAERSTLLPGRGQNYAITVSTPTTIKVTCRWWGGGTTIRLLDTNGIVLDQMVAATASPWEFTTIMTESVTQPGIYVLRVRNPSTESIGYELEITYESDINGNGVLDSEEFWFDSMYFSMDSDSDSIDDGREMILRTSRFSNDSDSDQMSDSWELENGLDPLDAADAAGDADLDGLSNLEEFVNNCDPNSEDSDADQMPDLWEVENGLNPLFDDAEEDPDRDGVSNLQEYLDATDPNYPELRLEQYFVPSVMIGAVAVVGVGIFAVRRRA